MTASTRMDRRAFLFGAARRRVIELSCERLYMRYLDARGAGRTEQFLDALERDLASAGEIRLTGHEWLTRDDFRTEVGPLLRQPRTHDPRHT